MATKASKKKHTAPAPDPQRDMFVIMPFSGTKSCTEEQWTDIFENVFAPAAEAAGLACSRARVSTGSLIKSIVERLRTAYIVLADITDANPNVFYELGVRHSLSKRTIVAAQGANHIPSDLRGYWSLLYGTEPRHVKKFAEDLKDLVDQIDAEPEKPDSPVGDYLEKEFAQFSRSANLEIARKLASLHTELSAIEIELTRESVNHVRNALTEHPCLSDFLEAGYIDPGIDLLKLGYETRDILRLIAAEGIPHGSIPYAQKAVAEFRKQVALIRSRVSSGSYVHPENLSVMEWSPIAEPCDGHPVFGLLGVSRPRFVGRESFSSNNSFVGLGRMRRREDQPPPGEKPEP